MYTFSKRVYAELHKESHKKKLKIKRRQTDSLGMRAGHMIASVEVNWKQRKIHMNLYYQPHKFIPKFHI
jgi:hypothetical protein